MELVGTATHPTHMPTLDEMCVCVCVCVCVHTRFNARRNRQFLRGRGLTSETGRAPLPAVTPLHFRFAGEQEGEEERWGGRATNECMNECMNERDE